MGPVLSVANPHQHSQAWWLARRGRITASRMHIVMNGGAKAWRTLADTLTAELLMDDMPHVEDNAWKGASIAHGIEYEPIARTNAELALGADFDLVGFQQHPLYDFIGASPDFAWTGQPGEIKCPTKIEKHMEVFRTLQLPAEHKPQVQCQIACMEASQAHFVSYSPKPAHWKMRCVVVLVERDDSYIRQMYERCQRFKEHVIDGKPLIRALSSTPKYF